MTAINWLSIVREVVLFVCFAGVYSFKVDLTEMTAAASTELWMGTDTDPLGTNKVLSLIYDDLVRVSNANYVWTAGSKV